MRDAYWATAWYHLLSLSREIETSTIKTTTLLQCMRVAGRGCRGEVEEGAPPSPVDAACRVPAAPACYAAYVQLQISAD